MTLFISSLIEPKSYIGWIWIDVIPNSSKYFKHVGLFLSLFKYVLFSVKAKYFPLYSFLLFDVSKLEKSIICNS